MIQPGTNSTRNWLFSHLADTVWSAAVGAGSILVLVPFNTDYWWASLTLVIATTSLAYKFRRHWLLICLVGLVLMLAANLALPFFSTSRDIYFLRCSRILECAKTVDVSYAAKNAKIYPVMDPIKWFIWKRLSCGRKNFRVIEEGKTTTGLMVLSSPTERSLTKMQRYSYDADSVNVFLRVSMNILTFNIATRANTIGYENHIRTRILEWRAPVRADTPGLFSAVGKSDDILPLAVEAVRGDLELRTILAGDIASVWKETIISKNRSLREEVRNSMIASGVMDRSLRGNIFSVIKLIAIRNAIAGIVGLQREYGDGDTLYRAAVLHYTNMLVSQEAKGLRNPSKLNFDPRDAVLFKDDLIHGIFFRLAKSEGAVDPAMSANQHYRDWIDVLNGKKPVGEMISKSLFEKHGQWSSPRRYPEGSFSASTINKLLLDLPPYSETFDRELYRATYEVISRIEENMPLLMSTLGVYPKVEQTKVATLQEKTADLLKVIQLLRKRTDRASSPASEIILSELRMMAALLERESMMAAATMPGASKPSLEDMFTDDPVSLLIIPKLVSRTSILKALDDTGSSCSPCDRRFLAHFLAEVLVLIKPTERDLRPESLRIVCDRLWNEYGEAQRCSSFIPGLMLLHAFLRIADDPRQQRTRAIIDSVVGADAGWLQDLYKHLGHPDLYEGRTRYERLTGHSLIDKSGPLH